MVQIIVKMVWNIAKMVQNVWDYCYRSKGYYKYLGSGTQPGVYGCSQDHPGCIRDHPGYNQDHYGDIQDNLNLDFLKTPIFGPENHSSRKRRHIIETKTT